MRRFGLAAGVLASGLMAGCVDTGEFNGGLNDGWPASNLGTVRPNPSLGNTSAGVKAALIDGCNQRYAGDARRIRECQNGYRHSSDALIDGCQRRYRDNGDKLRDCLSHAFR